MAWTRSISTVFALALAAAPALAQTPAKQADALNEQGKALLNAKPSRPMEATLKFRAAIVLSPEGRFYLNLCVSLHDEGKLGEALNMCKAVEGKGANATQVKQARTIIEKVITPKMRAAGLDPDAAGDPDPNNGNPDPNNGNPDPNNGNPDPNNGNPDPNNGNPDPNNGNPDPNNGNPDPNNGNPDPNNTNAVNNFTVAPQPSLLDQTTQVADHEYTWSLGAQVMGLSTRVGDRADYKAGAPGLRILGDYAIVRNKRIGAQGYISFFNVGGKADGLHDGESIFVVDGGIAIFKELCRGRVCVKPLAGVHVAALTPSEEDTNFTALGLRGELGIEYALGKRYENVITLGIGANVFFPSSSDEMDLDPGDPALYGLDKTSTAGYFAIGFTRRFSTPLGSQPLFQLQ